MPALRGSTSLLSGGLDTFADNFGTTWARLSIAKPATQPGDALFTIYFQNTRDPTPTPGYQSSPQIARIFSGYWGRDIAPSLWNYAYPPEPGYSTVDGGARNGNPYPHALEFMARVCDGTEPSVIHAVLGGTGSGAVSDARVNTNYDLTAEALSFSDANLQKWLTYAPRPYHKTVAYSSAGFPETQFVLTGGQGTYTITCPALPGVSSGTVLSLVAISADIGDESLPIANLTYAGTSMTLYTGPIGTFPNQVKQISASVGDLIAVAGTTGISGANGTWTVTAIGSIGSGATLQQYVTVTVSPAPTGTWTSGSGTFGRTLSIGTKPNGLTVIRDRSYRLVGTATATASNWWQYVGWKTWTATGSANTASTFTLSTPQYPVRATMYVTAITLSTGPRARAIAATQANQTTGGSVGLSYGSVSGGPG